MTGPDRRWGYTAHLAVLLTTLIGINIGYMAVLPFLPQLSARLGLDSTGLAVFVAGFAVAKIVAQPLGGWLADAWGLRSAGTLGLALAVVGIALVVQAETAFPAILGRLLWGAADGIISPALYGAVTVISAAYGRDPARGYAKLGTAALLSFAAGPFVVGLVHPFADYPAVLAAAAGLTLVNAVVAWRVLPRRAGEDPAAPDTPAAPSIGLRRILPAVALFGLIDLVANVLWAAMEPLVPLSLEQAGVDTTGRSAWVLTAGMVAFAVANPLLARLPERWRRPGLVGLGFAALAVSCFLLAAVDVLPVGLFAITVFMAAQSYIYLVAREGIRQYCGGTGTAWGIFGMFTDAGFVVGPVLAFFLFDLTGGAVFPILGVAAVLAAATASTAIRAWRPRVLSEQHSE
ncbi:MFS transporter [Amycolatopsis sp. cg9]|uniref:MFS transporter n=1 Tax=Amycolatopsis sp. cg9 TaxID=3238801 RepID=UPI003525EC5B